MSIDLFSQHFSDIHDPRQSAKVSYPLFDILFLTLCAVIAGCEGWEEIEDFGEGRLDWLQSRGLFLQGIPVHDTIARVIAQLDSQQLQTCFVSWMKAVTQSTDGKIIAIDGKTLRGSYPRGERRSTLHMVSAFATANGMVIGQVKTDEKSNEITAIPALLDLLEIKGCLVTIDAMGCQHKIAQKIVDKGADYLLAVKDNHPTLHFAVKKALVPVLKAVEKSQASFNEGHGRVEFREAHVLDAQELAEQFPDWLQLKSIGVIISYRLEKGKKESLEYRYYISSKQLGRAEFAQAVREHWHIENRLHWVLDVSMNEDACQIYRGHAAHNLACIRHMSLNMLRAETSRKASIPRKRRIALMNMNYLEEVLIAGLSLNEK